jgi:hypothetical protein
MLPTDMQLLILSFVSHEDKVNFALTCRGFKWMLFQGRVHMFISTSPNADHHPFPKAVERAETSAKRAAIVAQQMSERAAAGNADVDSAMGSSGEKGDILSWGVIHDARKGGLGTTHGAHPVAVLGWLLVRFLPGNPCHHYEYQWNSNNILSLPPSSPVVVIRHK